MTDYVNPAIDAGREAAGDPEIPDDLRHALHRIIIVGEDNPQSSRPADALVPWPDGCAGHRLMGILGLPEDMYLEIQRTNLCCPRWDGRAAVERALALLRGDVAEGDVVYPEEGEYLILALGAKVADRFAAAHHRYVEPKGRGRNRAKTKPLAPFDVRRNTEDAQELPPGCVLACIPHPSGRNQFWNSQTNHMRARQYMRELAPRVPWGKGL